jgi:ribonuclease T1
LIDRLKGQEAWRRSVRSFGAALCLTVCVLSLGNSVWARTLASEGLVVRASELPAQARETLELIKRGGPYSYAQDGAVFANRERRLPIAPRGTYREYTVKTPGRSDRGGRRIIASDTGQFWYSDDHYRSFRRIIE